MNRVNFSLKDEYHSQVNNKVIPLTSCTPTSVVMAGKTEGCMFDYPSFIQPEDYFTILLRSEYGIELRAKLTPWFVADDVPPNEIHLVVARMFNLLVGREVSRFDEHGTLEKLMAELRARHPVVATGGFVGGGHSVCVVGYVEDDAGEVSKIIVDDPFGDYFSGYRSRKGNDTEFPVVLFDRLWSGHMHCYRKEGFV